MITGYNTDVRHGEVVFHVQTEDKGAGNPFIESLVYVGGQVLASKRANYADLLAEGKNDKEIIALMDHQHRTMIAAIRHGKFDGKLAALSRPGGAGAAAAGGADLSEEEGPITSTAIPVAPTPVRPPVGPFQPPLASGPVRPPQLASGPVRPPQPTAAGPPPAAAAASGASGPVRPPAAASAASGLPPADAAAPAPERTLDQVILEYLTNEADQEQLVLLLDGESDLGLGRRAALALRASSSKSGLPIAGAQVSVRMISTVTEPRILAHGRTDEQGALPLAFEIPALERGTAALIITAVSSIGRAELKHLL
jgi:hypothetical protein